MNINSTLDLIASGDPMGDQLFFSARGKNQMFAKRELLLRL